MTSGRCSHPRHEEWWGTAPGPLPPSEFYRGSSRCRHCYNRQQQENRRQRSAVFPILPSTAPAAAAPSAPQPVRQSPPSSHPSSAPQQRLNQQAATTAAKPPPTAVRLLLADDAASTPYWNAPALPAPPHVAPIAVYHPLEPTLRTQPQLPHPSGASAAQKSERVARCRALALRVERILDLLLGSGDAVFPVATELSSEANRLIVLAREAGHVDSHPGLHPEFRFAAMLRPLWTELACLLHKVRECGSPAAVRIANMTEERARELRNEVEQWIARERETCGPHPVVAADETFGTPEADPPSCATCGGVAATAFCPGPCRRCYHPWCLRGTPFIEDRMCRECLNGRVRNVFFFLNANVLLLTPPNHRPTGQINIACSEARHRDWRAILLLVCNGTFTTQEGEQRHYGGTVVCRAACRDQVSVQEARRRLSHFRNVLRCNMEHMAPKGHKHFACTTRAVRMCCFCGNARRYRQVAPATTTKATQDCRSANSNHNTTPPASTLQLTAHIQDL